MGKQYLIIGQFFSVKDIPMEKELVS